MGYIKICPQCGSLNVKLPKAGLDIGMTTKDMCEYCSSIGNFPEVEESKIEEFRKKIKMAKIKINVEKCKGCNFCVDACPLKLIVVSKKLNKKGFNYVVMDSDKCTGCGLCFQMCPDLVIEVHK